MPKFRKKPVVIEAFQLPVAADADMAPFHAWAASVGFTNFTSERDGALAIPTLEGTMTADPGDWIIKGVAGEFYPCKPAIFAATYEASEEPPALGTDGCCASCSRPIRWNGTHWMHVNYSPRHPAVPAAFAAGSRS